MGTIEDFLTHAQENNLLRTLHPADYRRDGKIHFGDKSFLDFSSNDYLGLSSHPKLKAAAKNAIEQFGIGSGASRLLSGDLQLYHELEEKTAVFKSKEAALVFNSGYQANIGIISCLYKKGDAIFADKLCHASILDGISLSGAELFRFHHNDMNHLESLLKSHSDKFKNRLIVTETVFSMDGDMPLLRDIVVLKDKFDCKLMVDEAHATGIFGFDGSGVVAQEGLTDKVDLIMGTFSKALGSFGAYVAGPKQIMQYLINTCRSFIYSTALPPVVIAVNLAALQLIKDEPFRRQTLLQNADYFRDKLIKNGFEVKGCSQIIPLIAGGAEKAVAAGMSLREKGYWVLPIRPPTVPPGQSRLRFSLTYNHTKEILEALANDIIEIIQK
jgi:8-amino-7-oxononanoate synthase